MTDVPGNVWADIQDGMYRVIQTHSEFSGLGVSLAGKTGTAEIDYYQPNHGLFIGYAPQTTRNTLSRSGSPMPFHPETHVPLQMIL